MTIKPIAEGQTSHGPWWIEQEQGKRILRFDPVATQSVIDIDEPWRLDMQNLQYLMGILMFIPAPRKVLMLGVGGGSLLQFVHHHFPLADITGVDFDAELLDIARQHLLLPEAGEFISYQVADAREFLLDCTEQYDLILVDIFTGTQSPAWLLEAATIRHLKECLTSKGALASNLLINSENQFNKYYRLLRRQFSGQTLCLETEKYQNILTYAVNFKGRQLDMSKLMQKAMNMQQQYELPFSEMLSTIFNINPQGSGII